ncbi:type-2 ice-structuring protein-like [Pholidichthys leucotaenia]
MERRSSSCGPTLGHGAVEEAKPAGQELACRRRDWASLTEFFYVQTPASQCTARKQVEAEAAAEGVIEQSRGDEGAGGTHSPFTVDANQQIHVILCVALFSLICVDKSAVGDNPRSADPDIEAPSPYISNIAMKLLILSALLCAVLITAAEADSKKGKPGGGRKRCGCHWRYWRKRCYRVIPTRMSWKEAEENCQSKGGHLVSLRSLPEHIYVKNLISTITGEDGPAWTGGNDLTQEGTFTWTDSSPFNYNDWCMNEPNNYMGVEDCILMNVSGGKCWDDEKCTTSFQSVCVKDIL